MEEYTLDELYHMGKDNKNDPLGTGAEEYYLRMLELDPGESRANRELGIIWYDRGRNDLAREYLLASLENDLGVYASAGSRGFRGRLPSWTAPNMRECCHVRQSRSGTGSLFRRVRSVLDLDLYLSKLQAHPLTDHFARDL